jgi:CO/xanthine dehydrogenase Mo-binding subunit
MPVSTIGLSTPRRDSEPKVRGTTRFAADEPMVGLLHARLLLAHEAHAMITRLDTSAAKELPGVAAALTAADLPITAKGPGRANEPLAREEVIYAGQPVAMVVADTEAIATDALELIELELEPLEPVLDLETAAKPGAPKARHKPAEQHSDSDLADAHASVSTEEAGDEDELSDNVLESARIAHGDVEAAIAGSEIVLKARFETPWMYQGYLETQVATAWIEPGDQLTVSTSTQSTFSTRDGLAELFGIPVDRVRVRGTPLGGGFGGKLLIPDPLVAAAALLLGRPVRLAMTRSEDIAASNPGPGEILEVEIGADREGHLRGVRSRVLVDRGSTDDFGLESIAALLASGPYKWDAHELRAYGVATNRVTFGAYRAPCATPAAFAIESLIDELAERLGVDPIELRLQNVATEGDRSPSGRPFPTFGAQACLERLKNHPLWHCRTDLPEGEGIGVSIGWWPGGYEPAAAACRLDADGHLTVITGTADMTGVETSFAAIAAETFGVALDRVRVVAADTSSAPYAGMSGGSKITYTVGRAVEDAAQEARERLLEVAAQELEIAPEDLEITGGSIQPAGVPAKAIPLDRLAGKILSFGSKYAPVEGHGRVSLGQAPQSAGHISHVRVDRDTGGVQVLDHVVVQDVGRALNPALVEGQMRGGATQGLGWALWEEMVYDEHGQLATGTFVDYALPTASIVPYIQTEIVEVPAPEGPFGAKGVGEAPVVAAPAAVANAVAAATGGTRLRRLPMTAERIWRALRDHGSPPTSS